jgi:hypothetical protein
MKPVRKRRNELDLSNYDWSKASRGRFASRALRGAAKVPVAVRVLSDDLVEAFPDSESVNAALRSIAEAARRLKKSKTRAA